ncbi:MAG: energy transducer TonB [Candidatus Korobacteraceae bacterium]|jgi:TonB family protein
MRAKYRTALPLAALLLSAVPLLLGKGGKDESLGFMICSSQAAAVPTYEDVCLGKRSGELACGQRVEILVREGGFFRIRSNAGETYVSAASVSRSPKKFDPIPFTAPVAQPDCAAAWAGERAKLPGKQHPFVWFHPNPEYTDKARAAKLQGTVVLSLTVGTDGRPSAIHVEKSLGMGLDEKAIEALSKWRFDPAREDGNPVPADIKVDVKFRFY